MDNNIEFGYNEKNNMDAQRVPVILEQAMYMD
jgi:hypothetical protein